VAKQQAGPARVAVVGGGPAGLMAAEVLAEAGHRVTVYERMPSLGRKLLMAGRGGLNLTHSEPLEHFLLRYGSARERLEPMIRAFPPASLAVWCEGLGEATFVGSSGRIFPRSLKASPLLRAWLARSVARGVEVRTRHRWTGWLADGALAFETPAGAITVAAPDATVLALGGGSWARLGSDGAWVATLAEAGVPITPLAPANCGCRVAWSAHFRDKFAGTPLKRLRVSLGGETVKGELVVTREGLEGGALYALGPRLRAALAEQGTADVRLDLRPDLSLPRLAELLARPRGKQSLSTWLQRVARLPPVAIALLREGMGDASVRDPEALAALVKACPVRVSGLASIERAISTAGGVALDALDERLMVRARPGAFVAGEMLDWEAPTGGYLLQACLATGRAAGLGAVEWLAAGRGAAHRAAI
jgi:uncharacterized flavoprotein (TIGR03862 family)